MDCRFNRRFSALKQCRGRWFWCKTSG